MTYELTDSIPAPRPTKYPFSEMAVGQSFFSPGEGNATRTAASAWGTRTGAASFRCRSVIEDGIRGTRVWRIR